jgi:N-acetylglutamate synthase-like GNAT family acetyltransferase
VATIRAARTYDAPALAELCTQLGYAATRQQMVTRLAVIEADRCAGVLVAEDPSGEVVAWMQLALRASLVDEPYAEIVGLVVDAAARGARTGADLVRAAEAWARAHGASRVRVRSRTTRERAHRFYERGGYAVVKTQLVFDKPID